MTIREISKATGLSTTTICKALKNPSSIKPSTLAKIEKLNGSINIIKRFSTIHVIIPDLKNIFFSEFLSGALDFIEGDLNTSIQVHLSYDSCKKEDDIFKTLANSPREGIIWIPSAYRTTEIPFENILSRIVLADRDLDGSKITLKVLLDNENLAQNAVEYLLSLNLSNLCLINGPKESHSAQERARGALKADPNIKIYYTDFLDKSISYQIAKECLKNQEFDGFLLGNQTITIGMLHAYQENRNTPFPTSITFDRFPMQEFLRIPLSYIALPAYQMGKTAISMLLESNMQAPQQKTCILQGSLHLGSISNL